MRRRRSVTVSHYAHCFGSYCNQDYWTSNTTDTSAAHSILLLHICKRLKFNQQIMSDSSLKMDPVLFFIITYLTPHTCLSPAAQPGGGTEEQGGRICQRVAAVCFISIKLTDPRLIWWMMFKRLPAFMLTSSKPTMHLKYSFCLQIRAKINTNQQVNLLKKSDVCHEHHLLLVPVLVKHTAKDSVWRPAQ